MRATATGQFHFKSLCGCVLRNRTYTTPTEPEKSVFRRLVGPYNIPCICSSLKRTREYTFHESGREDTAGGAVVSARQHRRLCCPGGDGAAGHARDRSHAQLPFHHAGGG